MQGAYGYEIKDVLVDCIGIDASGDIHAYTPDDMGLSYRHNDLPSNIIFVSARFKNYSGKTEISFNHELMIYVLNVMEASPSRREQVGQHSQILMITRHGN